MAAEFGHLGALDRSVERISATLTDWDMLPATEKRGYYRPIRSELESELPEIEVWLLACALFAHPAEALPFSDLLRLPELFPFHFSVKLEQLSDHPFYEIHREGSGWYLVRLSNEF